MNPSKVKGSNAERKVLKLFQKYGYRGLRSPSSLSKTDLLIDGLGTVQVKYLSRLKPFYDELFSHTKRTDVVIYCGELVGTYLETFLKRYEYTLKVELKNSYSLHRLIEGQDYLVFASQYRPFMIFKKSA